MSHAELQYDREADLMAISIDSDLVFDGFEITAFGSEYENADTMFAVWVGEERVETKRPEPLIVDFLSEIVDDREFLVIGETKQARIPLDEGQQVKMAKIAREIHRGLKDSPLGHNV